MIELQTTNDVIDELGGNRPVAAITKRSAKQVSNWRSFEKFPAKTYRALTTALEERGKSAPPSLWGQE